MDRASNDEVRGPNDEQFRITNDEVRVAEVARIRVLTATGRNSGEFRYKDGPGASGTQLYRNTRLSNTCPIRARN
jgi:hypothetical protein